jgi:hypothetical protein
MLYTDDERSVMSTAVQPSLGRTNVAVGPYENIINDFIPRSLLTHRVLELGPGQCDFLDLVRNAGGHAVGVDFDPAVCNLGRLRGHEMVLANLRDGIPAGLDTIDGIFCRGSINAYWFTKRLERLDAFLEGLGGLIRSARWTWIAPWNNPAGAADADLIEARLATWRENVGLRRWLPSSALQARYGMGYQIPQIEIWLRGTNEAPLDGAAQ